MSARRMAVLFTMAGFHLLPTEYLLYVTSEITKRENSKCKPKIKPFLAANRVLLIHYVRTKTFSF